MHQKLQKDIVEVIHLKRGLIHVFWGDTITLFDEQIYFRLLFTQTLIKAHQKWLIEQTQLSCIFFTMPFCTFWCMKDLIELTWGWVNDHFCVNYAFNILYCCCLDVKVKKQSHITTMKTLKIFDRHLHFCVQFFIELLIPNLISTSSIYTTLVSSYYVKFYSNLWHQKNLKLHHVPLVCFKYV